MLKNYSTPRLLLESLCIADAAFIRELVNTPEWLRFIGERNVHTLDQAERYIQKLIDSPVINYWVVKLQETGMPVGVVTLIQRSYLDHHDIGFAFLPAYAKQGYAYEAAAIVLDNVLDSGEHSTILATTIAENERSIRLLEKLGLSFYKEIENEGEKLLLYSITADKHR